MFIFLTTPPEGTVCNDSRFVAESAIFESIEFCKSVKEGFCVVVTEVISNDCGKVGLALGWWIFSVDVPILTTFSGSFSALN